MFESAVEVFYFSNTKNYQVKVQNKNGYIEYTKVHSTVTR